MLSFYLYSVNILGETFYDSNIKRILDLNTSDNFSEYKHQSLR